MGPRDAPVIKLNTETEVDGFGPFGIAVDWRRRDSDAPDDRYREWEVGGSSHDDASSLFDPGNLTLTGVPAYEYDCEHTRAPYTSPTTYPYRYYANAAYEAMTKWVTRGTKPARVRGINQTNLRHPTTKTVKRDRFGNPLGGVFSPYFEVPIATYNVIDEPASAGCFFNGWSDPFSHRVLRQLYPTHANYVRKFTQAARHAVRLGVWTRTDAQQAVREAKKAAVP
jgi:hypothetical protein